MTFRSAASCLQLGRGSGVLSIKNAGFVSRTQPMLLGRARPRLKHLVETLPALQNYRLDSSVFGLSVFDLPIAEG
jgi:hypothetical protein